MKFYDMNTIADHLKVDNKYMITLAVAHRARQISEHRPRPLIGEEVPAEKYISESLEELEKGKVLVTFGEAPEIVFTPAAELKIAEGEPASDEGEEVQEESGDDGLEA